MPKTVEGHDYLAWSVWPPPRNTWVWAIYDNHKEGPQLLLTCRRGCCIHSAWGCMLLPNWWRLATEEEGAAERKRWDERPKLNPMELL